MHTIHARLNHPDAHVGNKNLYCFTDPEKNLLGEPLMEEATVAISHLFVYDKRDPATAVTINFTDNEAEAAAVDTSVGYCCILSDPKPARGGHEYDFVCHYPEHVAESFSTMQAFLGIFLSVWLCPALLSYFSEAPQQIFIQILEETE